MRMPIELYKDLSIRGQVTAVVISDLQALRALRHMAWHRIKDQFTEKELKDLKSIYENQMPSNGYRCSNTMAANIAEVYGASKELCDKLKELKPDEIEALYCQLE